MTPFSSFDDIARFQKTSSNAKKCSVKNNWKSFLFSSPNYDCIEYQTYTKVAYSVSDED